MNSLGFVLPTEWRMCARGFCAFFISTFVYVCVLFCLLLTISLSLITSSVKLNFMPLIFKAKNCGRTNRLPALMSHTGSVNVKCEINPRGWQRANGNWKNHTNLSHSQFRRQLFCFLIAQPYAGCFFPTHISSKQNKSRTMNNKKKTTTTKKPICCVRLRKWDDCCAICHFKSMPELEHFQRQNVFSSG